METKLIHLEQLNHVVLVSVVAGRIPAQTTAAVDSKIFKLPLSKHEQPMRYSII